MNAKLEVELAPMHMMRSFYPIIEFEANPEFGAKDKSKPARMELQCDQLAFEVIEGVPNAFRVILGLRMSWSEEGPPPYKRARLQCIGDFQFAPGVTEEVRERQQYMGAPGMLYSGAREFLKLLTANGPFTPIMLPGAIFKVVPNEDANQQTTPLEE